MPDPHATPYRVRVLLPVRAEIEAARQCTRDSHAQKHMDDALAALDAFEKHDLAGIIARAYRDGRADQYAKDTMDALRDLEDA